MVSERRHKRIESEILKVASISLEYIKDPKLKLITFTRVEVTDDLQYATIFYIAHKKKDYIPLHLEKAKGFFRNHISEKINLRKTPEIKFKYDDGLEYQLRIENLLQELKDEEDNRED
ncbi:MAG: 30S ribosome-binding factor RbfA [candidate division WOR-3 bacterium]